MIRVEIKGKYGCYCINYYNNVVPDLRELRSYNR